MRVKSGHVRIKAKQNKAKFCTKEVGELGRLSGRLGWWPTRVTKQPTPS